MKEKRSSPRKRVNERIEVVDLNTEEVQGYLANISGGGFMLVCPSPRETNRLCQLRILLPTPLHGREHIEAGAECLWCNEATQSGSFWAGYQIIDISEQDSGLIDQLISSWTE